MTTCPHSRDICDNAWATEGQPCCAACTHMSGIHDTTDQQPPEIVKVARDLTEIVGLYAKLLAQAIRRGDNADMPGAEAMVALAPVASIEAWENLNEATERYSAHADERLRRIYTSAIDEDSEERWSAYQLIKFWSEAWRRERGAEDQARPTLLTEVAFVHDSLTWAWENETGWDDMRRDVNKARVSLENILTAGDRQERTRVPCTQEKCERKPMLIKVYAAGDEHDDRWKCPACKHRYDYDEFQKAYASQVRSDGAKRYVNLRDALLLLRDLGRTEKQVRKWLEVETVHEADICTGCSASFSPEARDRDCPDCGEPLEHLERVKDPENVVDAYCELGSRTRWVWWPDIWTRHVSKPAKRSA